MTQEEIDSGQFSDEQLGTFQTLVDIVERLRAPGGCPWDRKQDRAWLRAYLLEEAYELLDALDSA